MRTSRPSACNKAPNCRSVARMAASPMLLMSPIVTCWRSPPDAVCAVGGNVLSVVVSMIAPFPRASASDSAQFLSHLRCVERLVEIGNDVVGVLDADAQTDHLRPHSRRLQFLG